MAELPPAADVDAVATRTRSRKPRMLHPVPPAPAWREEVGALRDVGDELAVALWRALRNVRLWAETEPDRRGQLFNLPTAATRESMGCACARAPELIEAFGAFMHLLRSPARTTKQQVADACHHVYEWAEARSLMLTAMHFAEAAAVVDSEDPARANDAGWMCYRAAFHERAGNWYQRGYELALRLRGQQETVSRQQSIRALLRYGILMRILGRYDDARRYYERAARKAATTGRRQQAAKANHDLLTIAAEVGTFKEGTTYAAQALDLYPIHDPQLPSLAHDWAFLLVRCRYYTHAIPCLEMAVFRIQRPGIQALAWSTLAWAAAGARRRDRFDEAEQRALQLIALYDEYAPTVLDHLAEGACGFGEWDRAEQYATRALEQARNRKDVGVERDLVNLLSRIGAREATLGEAELPAVEQVGRLNRRLLIRLRKWKAPGPHGPRAEAASGVEPAPSTAP